MDLSIIVPCHNEANNITPLLWSLRTQIFSNIFKVEVVFSLDSCTDNTREIIEQFDFNNLYTIKITECNVGYCGLARNEGMKLATGKYIWFVDADDYILQPTAIEILLRYFEAYPQYSIIHFQFDAPADCVYKSFYMMMWQYCIKKELVNQVPFKKIKPSEDVVFWHEIAKLYPDLKAYDLPHTLYFYQSHGKKEYDGIIYDDKVYSFDEASQLEAQGIAPWYI